ncbi:MAG: YybH family protein [Burkholderiales bacterium]
MKAMSFATPQDAEAAFYEAFESADLEAMMAVWAEDEEVICVHPSGPRLAGHALIRESWRKIFANGPRLRFHLSGQQYMRGMLLSVHSVYENILVEGETAPRHPVIATNIYLLTAKGWRMLLHHACPAPGSGQPADEAPPAVLH